MFVLNAYIKVLQYVKFHLIRSNISRGVKEAYLVIILQQFILFHKKKNKAYIVGTHYICFNEELESIMKFSP